MAFYVEKDDKCGFKSVCIPKQINTLTMYYAFEYKPEARKYLGERLRNNLLYEGLEPNSSEYFAGNYYLKQVNDNTYYVLDPTGVKGAKAQGIFIAYRYGDRVELKSALYLEKEDKLVLKMAYNTNDGSTHDIDTFIFEKGNVTSEFTVNDFRLFIENFLKEAYECEGLAQIIDIDKFRDIILNKTGNVLS